MRCSLPRPKWRTTGPVWVTHRRTRLGVDHSDSAVGHSDRHGSETPGTQLPREWSIPGLASGRPRPTAARRDERSADGTGCHQRRMETVDHAAPSAESPSMLVRSDRKRDARRRH